MVICNRSSATQVQQLAEAIVAVCDAERLDYDPSNLTTLVDRLQRRGAVERRPDPVDRGIQALVLTPAGEQFRETSWHDLIEDPGPLAPLDEPAPRNLAKLLTVLDQQER